MEMNVSASSFFSSTDLLPKSAPQTINGHSGGCIRAAASHDLLKESQLDGFSPICQDSVGRPN